MNRYFITGTDTDCGKTYVTSRLLNYFSQSAAIKPIASGCDYIEDQLVNSDAKLLHDLTGVDLKTINPWRLKLPVSPNIAAESEKIHLSALEIADYCLNLELDGIHHLFIEGAGGLMVPINGQETWIEMLQISEIPVILVVGMKLGCMNHALLTETVLKANKIQCVGWIANCIDPHMQALEENITTLTKKLAFPMLSKVSFGGDILAINSII